jgi:hypothetical protein
MRRNLVGVLLCLFGCAPAPPGSSTVTPTPLATQTSAPSSQGRAEAVCCLAGVEASGPTVYVPGTKPSKLRLYAASESDADLLVAGFENGSLSPHYSSRVVSLKAGQQQVLDWEGAAPADLYVAFVPPGSSDAQQLQQLAEKYRDRPEPDGAPAQRMYQLLTEWAGENSGVQRGGKLVPDVGGVRVTAADTQQPSSKNSLKAAGPAPQAPGARAKQEGMSYEAAAPAFDWRAHATKVRYDSQVHGVVVYTVGPSAR